MEDIVSSYSFKRLPCITINKAKLKYNLQTLNEILESKGMNAHFSTQAIAAYEPIIKIMHEAGIQNFADSNLDNLIKVKPYAKSTLLNRIPMISEARKVVQTVDISLNSELKVIFALSDAAVVENKKHGVILSVELGDLAEGILPEDLIDTIHQILNLRGIDFKGIRFNLNTFAGVKTTLDKLQLFADLAKQIEQRFDLSCEFVSGGNSGAINLFDNEEFPAEINHLILSQAWLLGFDTSNQFRIADLHQDIFSLYAEIIENKRKESFPQGEIGYNYQLENREFEDIGNIRRIILALGAQDVDLNLIKPKEKGIDFIGSTLDYSIYNISEYNREVNVGDLIEFIPNYVSLNRLFNAKRITKVIM